MVEYQSEDAHPGPQNPTPLGQIPNMIEHRLVMHGTKTYSSALLGDKFDFS